MDNWNTIGWLKPKKSKNGNNFLVGTIDLTKLKHKGNKINFSVWENKWEGAKTSHKIIESDPWEEGQGKQKNQLPETGNIPKQEDIAF